MGKYILIGRLLALHDLWSSGRIDSALWKAYAVPVMRQLHQEEAAQKGVSA